MLVVGLLAPLLAAVACFARRSPDVVVPAATVFSGPGGGRRVRCTLSLLLAACVSIPLVAALWESQSPPEGGGGASVAIVLDVSGSMEARHWMSGVSAPDPAPESGLSPSRLEAGRAAASLLLSQLDVPTSLVLFARNAVLAAPVTRPQLLVSRINALEPLAFDDGTAIGEAILCALNPRASAHLRPSAIVLLSDGADHADARRLGLAVRHAVEAHVPVYTVSTGKSGPSYLPVVNADGLREWRPIGEMANLELMRRIAAETGGCLISPAEIPELAARLAPVRSALPRRGRRLLPALALCMLLASAISRLVST